MNDPLAGLPGGVPIIGQSQQTPSTTSIVVSDETGRQIALPVVAVAVFTDSAGKDFADTLAPAVAAIVVKALGERDELVAKCLHFHDYPEQEWETVDPDSRYGYTVMAGEYIAAVE